MRQRRSRTASLALLALLVSLISSGVAQAAEDVPDLQWPAVSVDAYRYPSVTSPQGDVTVACGSTYNRPDQNLTTYDSTGAVSRQVSRTPQIGGVDNCIFRPVVDKNGDIYGKPEGSSTLLAYGGGTLKWQYATGCSSSSRPPAVGADGNIYFIDGSQHLIGITPDIAPGQTAPTKVLDVSVKGSCSSTGGRIYPYDDGIAVEWNYGARLQFISYSGKNLGEMPSSIYYLHGESAINAAGRVFRATVTGSTGFRRATVLVYNHNLGEEISLGWVSDLNADVRRVDRLYPTPDGGVVAILEQREVDEFGSPTLPAEWVTAVSYLSPSGVRSDTIELPNVDSNGNYYGASYFAVDAAGKLAITRALTIQRSSYPYSVPAVDISVVNPITGAVSYHETMTGNLSSGDGGIYGFAQMNYDTDTLIGPDTIYVPAECTGSCSDHDTKLYPIEVNGLGLDYPRGAVIARSPRASSSYVALGDSFSSGEGVTPFEADTALPGENTCHRSDYAYAKTIAGSSPNIPSLGTNGFRACSGAVTTNVTDLEQWNEGIQLDWWPDSSTQLVTMTIGGNDIGFSDFAKACVLSTCDAGTTVYNSATNKISNELPNKLKETYKRILAYAPNADIYIMDYPYVVPEKSVSDPDDDRCFYLKGGSTKWGDARAARYVISELNDAIADAISDVRDDTPGNQRLHYVPVNTAGSPFNGHQVCGVEGTSFFQNIDQAMNNEAYVFHPNKNGQDAYATILAAAINAG